MPIIRLHPSEGDDVLRFDLKEILVALGPDVRSLYWSVGNLPCHDQKLDATGEGADLLEELTRTGERIIGTRLVEIALSVRQIIWGEFKGYRDQSSEKPRVSLVAIDSTFWEVDSEEASFLNRIAKAFDHVEKLDLVFVLHHVRCDDEYGDDAKLIGVYRSHKSAETAIARLRGLSGFRDHPTGFHIAEFQLDKDHWEEGFIKTSDA